MEPVVLENSLVDRIQWFKIYTLLAPSMVNKFIKFKFTRNVTVFAVDEMPPTGIVINGDVTT